MISLHDLKKAYGKTVAVDGITFTVDEGQVCVMIGPSGCGKSTTMRLINRMIEPTSGKIEVKGKGVRSFNPQELRRMMGYVIQQVGLFPHMSVSRNVSVVPRLLGWSKERINKRVDELLDLIGLDPDDYRNKFPHQLSGGEAQRVGVARALAADPPILLMDEPFGAVDPLNRIVLQTEFSRIQRELKKTVLFVTHDLDEAIKLGDKIVLIRAGKVVQEGPPETILADPAGKFVRDFVGTDRALKRLSRFTVGNFMHGTSSISRDSLDRADVPDDKIGDKCNPRFLWVTDSAGKVTGWINRDVLDKSGNIEEAFTEVNPKEYPLREYGTMREALARILAESSKCLPVVDKSGILKGELCLKDVEELAMENQ
ncbi:MAG: ATP-binding cassette domain-containing protein [Spirochaetia bacterium]